MSSLPLRLLLALFLLVSILQKSDGAFAQWCVADEQTPDTDLQQAMTWACQHGADCRKLQVNQACYLPNTMKDHASYAFNSYYQNMKSKGGSCYFRAAAITTEVDPSHGACKFDFIPDTRTKRMK